MKKWLLIWMGLHLPCLTLANPLDVIKPLLPDLPGWQAQTVSGANSSHRDIHMITASRRYTRQTQILDAVIFVTSQASETGWLDSDLQFDSAGSSIKTETVDGFQVFRVHRKYKNEILLIVVIRRENQEGVFLSLTFKNMPLEEAMNTARLFDWHHIEFMVSSIN